jgi:hypothetical protein
MKYMTLDQRGQVQAEYIWIDAVSGPRSKTKVSLPRFAQSQPHFRSTGGMGVGAYRLDKPCARWFLARECTHPRHVRYRGVCTITR